MASLYSESSLLLVRSSLRLSSSLLLGFPFSSGVPSCCLGSSPSSEDDQSHSSPLSKSWRRESSMRLLQSIEQKSIMESPSVFDSGEEDKSSVLSWKTSVSSRLLLSSTWPCSSKSFKMALVLNSWRSVAVNEAPGADESSSRFNFSWSLRSRLAESRKDWRWFMMDVADIAGYVGCVGCWCGAFYLRGYVQKNEQIQ